MDSGLSPQVLLAGIVLIAALAIFGVIATVMSHHWNRYEADTARRGRARKIFLVGAGLLLLFMLGSFLSLL